MLSKWTTIYVVIMKMNLINTCSFLYSQGRVIYCSAQSVIMTEWLKELTVSGTCLLNIFNFKLIR